MEFISKSKCAPSTNSDFKILNFKSKVLENFQTFQDFHFKKCNYIIFQIRL